ncbi:hypothetical protein [Sphingobacterium detergens]|uniref:hypothetical protein n=1 Tax=Sphingobacterium detergens TaxID=1145106 RepID=UPI003AAFA16A
MALQVKLQFLGQDRSGREIQLKDATGFQSFGRISGYDSHQPSEIEAYRFSFSRIGSDGKLWVVIDGTNPRLLPPAKIAMGIPFSIHSSLFQDSIGDLNLASSIFSDGILDINMYVQFVGLSDVVIAKDSSFVTGGSFKSVYDSDSILVDGMVYELDKSKDHNGYTVLYIIGSFSADATSFDILYRSNTKAFLDSVGDYNLQSVVGSNAGCSMDDMVLDTLVICMANKESAELFYKSGEYSKADELLISRDKLLKNIKNDNCNRC